MTRVLLLLEHKENRRLLREWLEEDHQVLAAGDGREPEERFDLGIVDDPALTDLLPQLQARKKAEEPVFLPLLLVCSRQDVGLAQRYLWRTVDEIAFTPLERVELEARVQILLRARRLSLKLHGRCRRVFETVPLGLYRTTPDGAILQANAALAKLLGYPDFETLIGVRKTDLHVNPHDGEIWLDQMEQAGGVRDFETRLRRRDGSIIWVAENTEVVRDAGGQPLYYEGSLEETSERGEEEARLRRANRALRMLSECNRAVIRAKDELALLDDICRIIVDVGGYPLAWVGFAERDEPKTVRPVAQRGYGEGYLDALDISWADTERGRGPIGTAIRTGEPTVARNIPTDPDLAPWQEAASRRGYASSIALPLVAEGRSLGALNIYATGPDAFDAREVKLLTELAEDLAFGIQTLPARATRRRAQQRLQRVEALLLEQTQALARVGGWEYDVEEGRMTWTDGVYRIYGVDPATYDPNDIEEDLSFYTPQAQPCLAEAFRRVVKMGEPYDLTLEFKNAQGERRWVRTLGRAQERDGEVVRVFGHIMDVTDRVRAEEEVRRNEEILRFFVEHSPAAIAMFDREMRYIVASRRYRLDYDLGEQDLVGRSHYDVFPEIPERWKEIHRRCLEGAVERCEEDLFPRADGTLDWVRWEIRPWREMNGEVGGLILLSEVITERKEAEEELRGHRDHLEELVEQRTAELRIAKEQAESADRLKSAFLAAMSHELRTPLNSIIGFAGILLQELAGPLNPEQKKQLRMLQNSARRLLALINDVLDISKIEAGEVEIAHEPFDVRQAIQGVVQTVGSLAEEKGLDLTVEMAPQVGRVVGDRRRVEQILLNLLNNAVKFTNEGGVHLTAGIKDGCLVISVSDTGIGIAAGEMDELFDPFSQIETGLTRQYEGTGLGLSICQRLVGMMGGEIWAESEGVGEGSTFVFTLPV